MELGTVWIRGTAMKVTCIERTIKDVLGSDYYRIPRFQRPYSWEKEHVEDFLTDAIVENPGDYFIGSMVAFKYPDGTYGLVDGQQRLTTITMMLCALREAFDLQGESELAKGLHKLIERKDLDYKNRYILGTETSYPYLQEHIQKYGEPGTGAEMGDEEECLQDAFLQLQEYVESALGNVTRKRKTEAAKKKLATKKLTEMRDKILSLTLIFIALDDEDEAYLIFETLNTRGRDLRLQDLVKSRLTRLLKPTNRGVDLAKDKWVGLVERIESSEAEMKVDSFLHHFWLSKYQYVTVKKVFKALKRKVTGSNAHAFLTGLDEDSVLYREIHEPSFRKWTKQDGRMRGALNALNLFKVQQQIPMVLSVLREFRDGGLDRRHVIGVLQAIEKFHFVFTAVTSQRSSGGISFMYALHARELGRKSTKRDKVGVLSDLKTKLKDRIPPYGEFEANFQEITYSKSATKHRKLVQYILARLQEHHTKSAPVDYDFLTVEHISPQGSLRSATASIGQIGNLIGVSDELNQELGSKDFKAKKAMLSDAGVWLDDTLMKAPSWTSRQIEARTKALAKICYEVVWRIR